MSNKDHTICFHPRLEWNKILTVLRFYVLPLVYSICNYIVAPRHACIVCTYIQYCTCTLSCRYIANIFGILIAFNYNRSSFIYMTNIRVENNTVLFYCVFYLLISLQQSYPFVGNLILIR